MPTIQIGCLPTKANIPFRLCTEYHNALGQDNLTVLFLSGLKMNYFGLV